MRHTDHSHWMCEFSDEPQAEEPQQAIVNSILGHLLQDRDVDPSTLEDTSPYYILISALNLNEDEVKDIVEYLVSEEGMTFEQAQAITTDPDKLKAVFSAVCKLLPSFEHGIASQIDAVKKRIEELEMELSQEGQKKSALENELASTGDELKALLKTKTL